ncbi:NAD-dependent epimerase/dehydratase family protein [Streptomyces libani]|uniref:NAD-dependent epimerase/dehydratase family protein n=2 Tax=Streptomyces nigrescens TaxID=1920 RepID=A0ABY7IID3_STRNI|nr:MULTISPECIES: NAD-dependent epimerase/dehydratase family protein [Streptomyces]AWN28056.1 NAD-dependent dehydratase [Streptomyces sp. NEAU-S7GS2]MCX5451056.1 NAD-dependent epimerase/dehydratase family protein [Streptomyces libani]MYT17324.1 NAD-dependent epimerase/dehydratase family protein [Streptomyces sp. SID4951]WAT98187.1 NAD-dependent epimerase/dehydratase family protein [Streptomyces libani subsp. libani]WAU06157.1 NAD-dependent epimerase/dehydratase family protein [Streptomyces nigr
MGKVVLVTGVARQLGGRFVRRIQRDPDVDRVIGVDAVAPEHHLGGAEFLKADIRHPAIARVLAETGVDTVIHMDINGTPLGKRGGRASVKETNVIGTMQLLGACQKAPKVQRLVIKSSTSVYGSAPRDPAVFTETTTPKSLPSGGFAKDVVEVEGYVRGFARRRPDVAVCVLRFANILGPCADSPLAEYFSLPVWPTVLGYDPRLQFVHEDDAIEVLRIAAAEPRRGTLNSGTFNIAGDGVLLLSQTSRRLGRPTVPLLLPTVTWAGTALRSIGITDFSPEQIRLLTHGRVVETTQMRETLGFHPKYTTAETFAEFARSRGPGLLPPESLARTVDRLAGVLPARSGPTQ